MQIFPNVKRFWGTLYFLVEYKWEMQANRKIYMCKCQYTRGKERGKGNGEESRSARQRSNISWTKWPQDMFHFRTGSNINMHSASDCKCVPVCELLCVCVSVPVVVRVNNMYIRTYIYQAKPETIFCRWLFATSGPSCLYLLLPPAIPLSLFLSLSPFLPLCHWNLKRCTWRWANSAAGQQT